MGYRVGVDVGGTFTDLICVTHAGEVVLDKTPTTLDDQSIGVMNGLAQLAERGGLSLTEFCREVEILRSLDRDQHGIALLVRIAILLGLHEPAPHFLVGSARLVNLGDAVEACDAALATARPSQAHPPWPRPHRSQPVA